jgi:3-oxoadipate enol-lactonase
VEVNAMSLTTQIHIESHGEGPALLCIHGLGGGAYFFTALAHAVKSRIRTISLDLPGHGFSPRDPKGFCFERCADQIVELTRQHSSQPLTLLGHSLGTILALKAYARAPELFNGLISVGGLPEPLPETKQRLHERAAFIRARGSMVGLGESILPFLVAPQALKAMPGMLGPMQRLIENNDALAYAETCEALAGASATDIVKTLRIPCRVITGSEDRYAPPYAAKDFARQIPGHPPLIEFADCGHFPFFEKPIEFQASVAGFVEN